MDLHAKIRTLPTSPGVYLYKLTRTPFDTTRLPNGIYTLRVTATDIRGNTSSSRQVFIVHNGHAL